jgi:predicted amidophosphoribosyltransferase
VKERGNAVMHNGKLVCSKCDHSLEEDDFCQDCGNNFSDTDEIVCVDDGDYHYCIKCECPDDEEGEE